MIIMTINYISKWYAHEYTNEYLIYITNMSSEDISHDIYTVLKLMIKWGQ